MTAPDTPAAGEEPREQWWLAELDRYGNPNLVDGAHDDREGVLRARATYYRLHSGDNHFGQRIGTRTPFGYAIARVLLEPLEEEPNA